MIKEVKLRCHGNREDTKVNDGKVSAGRKGSTSHIGVCTTKWESTGDEGRVSE